MYYNRDVFTKRYIKEYSLIVTTVYTMYEFYLDYVAHLGITSAVIRDGLRKSPVSHILYRSISNHILVDSSNH